MGGSARTTTIGAERAANPLLGAPSEDAFVALLLADHQTTGGYPKIATVLEDDLDGFVQCRPREAVAFQSVTPDEAVQIARAAAARFAAYLAVLLALSGLACVAAGWWRVGVLRQRSWMRWCRCSCRPQFGNGCERRQAVAFAYHVPVMVDGSPA